MTSLTTRIETGSDKLKIAILVSFKERKKRIIDTYLDYYFNENTFEIMQNTQLFLRQSF